MTEPSTAGAAKPRTEPSTAGAAKPRHAAAPGSSRGRRRLVAVVGVLVVAVLGTVTVLKVLERRYEGAVQRQDLLGPVVHASIAPDPLRVTGPLTFLLIGSDSRAGDNANPDTPDGTVAAIKGQRSDVIMLLHVPKSTDRAYVISIPRDAYLPIADRNGDPAGRNKINAAFAFGGAPRLVQTLNNYTGGRIDYPIIVDFSAIRTLTDLVGGVDVVVDRTSYDPYRFLPANTPYPVTPCEDTRGRSQRCVTFKAGTLHLDGQLAEYYVRQREGLPAGDFDRMKRQQQYLRALLTKATSGDTIANPVKFDKLVRTALGALTVDTRMPVSSLVFSLKGLRPGNLTFLSLPIADTTTIPGVGWVAVPDAAGARELFTALNTDTLDQYVARHPTNDVSHGA